MLVLSTAAGRSCWKSLLDSWKLYSELHLLPMTHFSTRRHIGRPVFSCDIGSCVNISGVYVCMCVSVLLHDVSPCKNQWDCGAPHVLCIATSLLQSHCSHFKNVPKKHSICYWSGFMCWTSGFNPQLLSVLKWKPCLSLRRVNDVRNLERYLTFWLMLDACRQDCTLLICL